MSWASVNDWLRHVDASTATTQKKSRKRSLKSPPIPTTPRKKNKKERHEIPVPILQHQTSDSDDEVDASKETSRPAKRSKSMSDDASLALTSGRPSSSPDQTGSVSTRSNGSGHSSPARQIARLRINATMQHRMIDDGSGDFPESLRTFLGPIKRATTLCRDLFLTSQRQEIRDYALANPTQRRNFDECYQDDVLFTNTFAHPGEYAPHLDPKFVHSILDKAIECDESLHHETSWNMMVYYPLMRGAIMGLSRRCDIDDSGKPLVSVVPCITASLIADFKVRDAPTHKVDFAIALEPSRTAIADKIDALRESMPGWSVNHTDYAPLLRRPIAISVETNCTDGDFERAMMQLMVWLAAQWTKYESMTDRPPDILPAIIIQGHDWYLVASTRANDGKKFLWCKHNFGSTSMPLGIYKIAWTLRYLASWAIDTHWSWFEGICLGLDDRAPEESVNMPVQD